jgi:hypothetical protein
MFVPGYPAHQSSYQLQHDVYRGNVSLKPLMKQVVDTGYVVYYSPSKMRRTRPVMDGMAIIVRKRTAVRGYGNNWQCSATAATHTGLAAAIAVMNSGEGHAAFLGSARFGGLSVWRVNLHLPSQKNGITEFSGEQTLNFWIDKTTFHPEHLTFNGTQPEPVHKHFESGTYSHFGEQVHVILPKKCRRPRAA